MIWVAGYLLAIPFFFGFFCMADATFDSKKDKPVWAVSAIIWPITIAIYLGAYIGAALRLLSKKKEAAK